MKILHVINSLEVAGAEMSLYKLVSSMDQLRFDQTIVSLGNKGTVGAQIESLKIPVHPLGMTGLTSSFIAIQKLVRVVRSFKPHVIQGWMYYGNLAATAAGGLAPGSRPVLWNIRHTPRELRVEKAQLAAAIRAGAHFSRFATRIIYCADVSAKLHEYLGYRSDRRIVIPNGCDLAQFTPLPEHRASVRAELGIGETTPVIGIAARYHPIKDHSNFLKAAAILAVKRPDVHFLMAGRGLDKNNESIVRLIRDSGLDAQTHLLGERHDMPRLMSALDLACCSSAWGEAFPNIVAEAMACGVPCVSTDVGDVARIIGQTGSVVPPRNPWALAEACQALLAMDAEGRRTLGEQARSRIKKQFSLTRMVEAYQTLYEDIAVS